MVARVFDPYIKMLNAVPRVVLAPLFLLWFGLGIWSKVALAVTLVFFVMFFNTYQGVRDADRVLIDNVRMLGATERQLVRHVLIPSALTWIFSSLQTSLGFAMVGAVVGEYLGATRGLGYVISQAEGTFDTTGVFAGMTVLGHRRGDRQRRRDAIGEMVAAMESMKTQGTPRAPRTPRSQTAGMVFHVVSLVTFMSVVTLVSPLLSVIDRKRPGTSGWRLAARTSWCTCRPRSRGSWGSIARKGSTSSCRISRAARRRCRRSSAAAPTSSPAFTITRFRWRPRDASSSRSSRCCGFPGLVLVTSAQSAATVTKIEDLKGRIAGVTTAGSSSQMLLTYMLQRHGVAADAVSITAIGSAATAIAAIEHGKVDAGMMADPAFTLVARRNPGVRVLADLRTAAGVKEAFGADTYPGSVLYAKGDWIRANRDTTERLARVITRTLAWMQAHTAEEIAARTPTSVRGEDDALYVEALKSSMPMFSPDGVMPAQGANTVHSILAGSMEKVRSAAIDVSKTYTNEFIPGR